MRGWLRLRLLSSAHPSLAGYLLLTGPPPARPPGHHLWAGARAANSASRSPCCKAPRASRRPRHRARRVLAPGAGQAL